MVRTKRGWHVKNNSPDSNSLTAYKNEAIRIFCNFRGYKLEVFYSETVKALLFQQFAKDHVVKNLELGPGDNTRRNSYRHEAGKATNVLIRMEVFCRCRDLTRCIFCGTQGVVAWCVL